MVLSQASLIDHRSTVVPEHTSEPETEVLHWDIRPGKASGRGEDRNLDVLSHAQAADIAKTLDVVLDVKGMGRASGGLSLSRCTGVTAIDLNSTTDKDGATWHAPLSGAWSTIPDLIMLVAAAI
jgi:hypothetical protein